MIFLWTINGRTLGPEDLADPELAERVMEVTLQLQEKVGHVGCPEHEGGAVLEVESTEPDSYRLNVRGCCETLVDQVLERLA
jgi:hypothetical protein